MSYKTILLHIDDSRHIHRRIALALKLAQAHKAHVIGAALTGVSRFLHETVAVDPDRPNIVPYLETLRQRARQSLEKFQSAAEKIDGISHETMLIDDDPAGGLSFHSIYADLAVLGQFDRDDPAMGTLSSLPEYVAMNGACPVLLVPHSSMAESLGDRVLIAWNGSLEAKRAVDHALPILQSAKIVQIVSFSTIELARTLGEQPATDLAAYLSRHGVKAESMQEETSSDAGEALLSLAANLSSDLLVMGCYGHSRLRELILGGATRTVLSSATIPVLLSH